MGSLKVKKGDTVVIIGGKDKGADGRVLQVLPKKKRVIVEGINRVTRHEKIRMSRRGGQEGGIEHKEASVDISNVALVCPNDGVARIGYRLEANGEKTRICKKCGTEL